MSWGPGAGCRPRTPGKLYALRSEDYLHLESSGLFMCNCLPSLSPPLRHPLPTSPSKNSGYLKKSIPYFNMKRTLPRAKGSRRLVDSLCLNVPPGCVDTSVAPCPPALPDNRQRTLVCM